MLEEYDTLKGSQKDIIYILQKYNNFEAKRYL